MKTRPAQQHYDSYTMEDLSVWKILFERQMKNLEGKVSGDFMDALQKVKFRNDKIPDFTEINCILENETGWQLHTVPNISPQKEFFELLAEKKFTATCWLRTMEQLDYLEEPDMFHDVFAHVPLLSNHNYCRFFEGIGKLALKYINEPMAIELLGKIYWFTIEFGLIEEKSDLKIYGAGIISSAGETRHALSDLSSKYDFDVERIFETDFRTDILQERYFVIRSFAQLFEALPEIEEKLLCRIKNPSLVSGFCL
jgi:phenylalanine-4-hydroxylase